MAVHDAAAERAADDGPAVMELLGRLESMAARLDEQAALIARLEAASAPVGSPSAAPAANRLGRRGLLMRMLGATAAVGALALARDATPAHADFRGTLLPGPGTTLNFGLASTDKLGDDPLTYLPDLSGVAFGVIGTRGSPGFRPPRSAGVLGSGFDSGGVVGISRVDVGVYGQSLSGVGVIGTSGDGAGIYGFSTTSSGIYGVSPNNVGIFGQGTRNAGVFGTSPVYGVWGRTASGFGINGEATAAGIGVYGRAGSGGWAGYFEGNVYVTGRVVQAGGAAPQAATTEVADAVGRAKLAEGRATVAIDAQVAATLGGDYHVFLTEYGESRGLYVSGQGPTSFEVRERQGGTSSVPFSYRVVAAQGAGAAARPEPGRRGESTPSPERGPVRLPVERADVRAPEAPAVPTAQPNDLPKRQRP